VLPVENERVPETPAAGLFAPCPFAVRILKDPLEVVAPYPDMSENAPPDFSAEWPALRTTRPPSTWVPVPIATLRLPAAPFVLPPPFPVRSINAPLVALELPPVEKLIDPLTPSWPPLDDRMLNTPLDLARPYPDTMDMAPPVNGVPVLE
jgi:hypothetical protein